MVVASGGTGKEIERLVQSTVPFSASAAPLSSISIVVPLSILSHRDAPSDTPSDRSSARQRDSPEPDRIRRDRR